MKRSIIFVYICLFIFLSFVAVHTEEQDLTPSALKAMGAPNNPKVEIAWNRYYDWKQIGEICKRLANAHPDIIKLGSIGTSFEKRDIYLLTVTDFSEGSADDKPAMYIDGNIHSNEIQGAEVGLYTAWYMAENRDAVPWIAELLKHKTFYIVPTINPDARDHFIHEANTPHSPRTGLVPRDTDGDGLFDEDGYDDLDGDGNIVRMRKRDPNGRWKVDPDDPRLMVQARPDEPGEYRDLGWEGIDNDGDGRINEDGPGYYDPNRNWGWGWQPAYIQHGSDQYPFSIPENRAVADFIIHHPNIGAAQSYHNSGGMILRGPGSADDAETYHPLDRKAYDFLGELGEKILPGYRYLVLHKDLYKAVGGELDWLYGAQGIFTFTNELWTSFHYYRKSYERNEWQKQQKDIYQFDKLLLFGEGIVPWKKIQHPQYGEIEIGGVKKAWTRTAPSFMMEDMCHRNMAFTLFNAYHLPQIRIDKADAKLLGSGLYQLDVVLKNSRILPTRSAHEVAAKINAPDNISISGKNVTVIAGMHVEDPYLHIIHEQKYRPDHIDIESIPGMSTIHIRWLFTGKLPATVTYNAARGGIVKKRITSLTR